MSTLGGYNIPKVDTPTYNLYFERCVIHTDEIMLSFNSVLNTFKRDKALEVIQVVYADRDVTVRSLYSDMVFTIYDKDIGIGEKLDIYFYKCLDAVYTLVGVE